jgi:hypothetical protein
MDPAAVVGRQTAVGNHTMDVGMSVEVLAPGVENGKEADLSAEVFGVSRDPHQVVSSPLSFCFCLY